MDEKTGNGQSGATRGRTGGLPGLRRCGGHWGVADMYAEFAARLRTALESGQPCALMWRAAKVPTRATVTRETARGPIMIEVRAYAGDEALLTDSIIWSAFGASTFASSGRGALRKAGFGDLTWESVRAMLTERGHFAPENAAHADATVFCEASFDDVLEELAVCEQRAQEAREARYAQAVTETCAEIKRWYGLASAGGALRLAG